MGTRDVWASVWGWVHPLQPRGDWAPTFAHTWRLGHALVLGPPLRTRGAWAAYLGAGHTPAHT
jgi:hypothetical protein